MLQLFNLTLLTDLDFNGTLQTLVFTADRVPFSETVTISLYSDGVSEGEEGFVVVFGVSQDELDDQDSGFVNVAEGAFLVILSDGGKNDY